MENYKKPNRKDNNSKMSEKNEKNYKNKINNKILLEKRNQPTKSKKILPQNYICSIQVNKNENKNFIKNIDICKSVKQQENDKEQVIYDRPQLSKEDTKNKINLVKGTENTNKIESSSKKGKNFNNFKKKEKDVKIKLNLYFRPKSNKIEKNIENHIEKVSLKPKLFHVENKNNQKIQNNNAKKIMKLNITNNKDESKTKI